jgi:hypothetical protein
MYNPTMRSLPTVALTAASIIALSIIGCSRSGRTIATKGTGREVSLQMNLDKGQKLIYDTKSTTSQTIGAESYDIKGIIVYLVEVTKKTRDSFSTKMIIQDFTMKAPKDMPGYKEAINAVDSVKGTILEGSYDNRGNNLSFEVKSDNPTAKALGNSIGGSNIGFMGLVYPENDISVGSTWESKIDFGKILQRMSDKVKVKGISELPVKYRVQKIEETKGKTIAVIEYTMIGTIELDMSATPKAGKVTIDSNKRGTLDVDVKTGAIVEMSQTSATTTHAKGQATTHTSTSNMKLRP